MPRQPKYTPEFILAVCAEWDARLTYPKLAKNHGLSEKQLNYILNILGPAIRKEYENHTIDIRKDCEITNGVGNGAHI